MKPKSNGSKALPSGILLDVGARDRKQANWIGLDARARPGIDIVHDLEKFPYPLKDASCLTIKAAHVIEHVKPWLVIPWMDEMWRLLKPDGQMAISAPYAGSPGYHQDPTHCTSITERTFLHFDPDFPLFTQYSPKPWKIEHAVYKPDGNYEAILRKRLPNEVVASLVMRGMNEGAIQKPTELSALIQFLSPKTLDTVVEIGTARGGVFYILCQLASAKAHVVSIDLPAGEFGGGYTKTDQQRFVTFAKPGQHLTFITEDSHKPATKKQLADALDGRAVDLLFIDGDHRYEGVKKDWEMYAPFVKDGGLVVFHDICFHKDFPTCKVDKLWKEIKYDYNHIEYIEPSDTTWGGIGVIEYRRNK